MKTRKISKTIALIAHDSQKMMLAEWVNKHREVLKNFHLIGTRGTCESIQNISGLPIHPVAHGPDGGDIIIAHQVLEGTVNALIFFVDMRTPHGHEHDIQTLIRISAIKNIPFALNRKTADQLMLAEKIKLTDEENAVHCPEL